MGVNIEVATEATDDVVEAVHRLVPQLSRSAAAPDVDALQLILDWQGLSLLVARLDGRVVGMLTLVVFPLPTGVRAWIEDVVVDQDTRGAGVGEALTREAVRLAHAAGARSVDLTSRPSREAANRLYRRVGFEARETNVYRHMS